MADIFDVAFFKQSLMIASKRKEYLQRKFGRNR